MDPKDNNTQNLPIDDQGQQPSPQQRADGELIVSHEVEADLTPANDMSASDPTIPPADPMGMAGNTVSPTGNDVLGGNNMQSGPFMPPEAPAAPQQQPVMPDAAMPPQPQPQPMPQPDPSQQFPPAAMPPAGTGMPPATPTDPAVAPLPPTPASPTASPKKRALVLVVAVMLGVILLGLGVYALMQI